jgi:hypothetical protein
VADARDARRLEQVAGRGAEELHHVVVGERRGVGDIHDHLRARERLGDPLPGDRVHARVGRGRDDLVPVLGEVRDDLGSDEARASDDDDTHCCLRSGGLSTAHIRETGGIVDL